MPVTLPPGYTWSAPLTKPTQLRLTQRWPWAFLASGVYDVACIPVGDNWMLAGVGAYKTVTLNVAGSFSIMPRFPVDEPSSGFLFVKRGPYTEGTAEEDRPGWEMSAQPGGQGMYRSPMPAFTHSGARRDRYCYNGYYWAGDGGWPSLSLDYYWRSGPPSGPMSLSGHRLPIVPAALAPDVTILSSVPDVPIYVTYCHVDADGNESECADPLLVAPIGSAGHIVVNHTTALVNGMLGYHVYVGTSPDDLHRLPVLDYEGSEPEYRWPPLLQQFVIHRIPTDTPAPSPSACVRNILNEVQQFIVDGMSVITMLEKEYDLYCPLVFHYDSANFGRTTVGKATFTHRTAFGGTSLYNREMPMAIFRNQDDIISNMNFYSDTSRCGIAPCDDSGGQAFNTTLRLCSFDVRGMESVALHIDQRATANAHICSELTIEDCEFRGTIPCKIEGEQTANVRFKGSNYFHATGNTRYLADTVGTIYLYAPNGLVIEPQGVDGVFRSLGCMCMLAGGGSLYIRSLFVDAPITVGITVGTYQVCNIDIDGGERINGVMRLIESPTGMGTKLKMRNITIPASNRSTCISFMLNGLALDIDVDAKRAFNVTEDFWLSRGLPLQYDGLDHTKKLVSQYTYGFSDIQDSIPVL